MEEWSQWLLQSLVQRAQDLQLCSRGELAILSEESPQPAAWWSAQLAESPHAVLRLIRLANSAAFSSGKDAHSLEEALEVLGHTQARHQLLQDLLERLFPARGREWISVAPRWRHVLAVAACAATLARHLKLSPGEHFVAGLLHDVGQHLLLKQGGEPYLRLEATFRRDPDPNALARAEKQHLGFDHHTLSAAVAASWGLPSSVVSMLRDHQQLEQLQKEVGTGTHLKRVAILTLAEQLAAGLGYGVEGGEAAVVGKEGWKVLLRELRLSSANQVLKLNRVELWWLQRKVEQQLPQVLEVARGRAGQLWEGPSLWTRTSQETLRLKQELQARLEQLRPVARPRALPAPAGVAPGAATASASVG